MTEEPAKTYRVISLQAENLKRLTAVEIRPDGNVVQIAGPNGSGKTSVLDALWWGLTGLSNVQRSPIRKGAEVATIKLDLGDIRITRRFKAKEEGGFTHTLAVEAGTGARFTSPQAVLDKIAGEIALDPLAFSRMPAKEQFDALKRLVPGVDFDKLATQDTDDREKRRAANARAKELAANAEAVQIPAGTVPKPVDEAALEKKLAEAADHNTKVERAEGLKRGAADRIAAIATEIHRLEAERASLQARRDEIGEVPAPIDTAKVREDLTAARQANAHVAAVKRKATIKGEADAQAAIAEGFSKAITDREASKQKAIARAKMPIDGLGFAEGYITLDGQPFDQASDAQQLEASCAIAAAMSPQLRVIRIRDGSLLDDNAMIRLAGFAEKHDMQVWIERVDTSGAVGFVMEDGHIQGQAPAPAPATEAAEPEEVI